MCVRGRAVRVEEPVSSTCCSLWNSSRAGMSDGGSGLGRFSFFNTQQCHLGFSDMGHFCCWCGVPSCCIFYAIPFLEKPWRRRRAPGRRAAAAEVRASSGVPLFSLWLPLPIFLPSPGFVTCLHLFCHPTCTKCKKEFLNR